MCRYRPFVFRIFPHDLHAAFVNVIERENLSVDDPFQAYPSVIFLLQAPNLFGVLPQKVPAARSHAASGYEHYIFVTLLCKQFIQFVFELAYFIFYRCHSINL